MKNLDRNRLDANGFDGLSITYYVKQGRNISSARGIIYKNACVATNCSDVFYLNITDNKIIEPNDTIEVKTFGTIDFEANLKEPFELIFEIENSKGENEKFIYTVK